MVNSTPSFEFINIVSDIVKKSRCPVRVAEVGVDRGATTLEIINILRPGDTFDLFDREDCPLFKGIEIDGNESFIHNAKCKINIHKNSRKIFDSYSWSLAKLAISNRGSNNPILFDAVYIDGAHTFPVDAPATCVLKELLKPAGCIVFDDMQWTLMSSPTMNKAEVRAMYTDEQMSEQHVKIIVDLFLRSDKRFTEIETLNKRRSIFIKNEGIVPDVQVRE